MYTILNYVSLHTEKPEHAGMLENTQFHMTNQQKDASGITASSKRKTRQALIQLHIRNIAFYTNV